MIPSTHGSVTPPTGYEVWAEAFSAHTGRRPSVGLFLMVCLRACTDPDLDAIILATHMGWPDYWL